MKKLQVDIGRTLRSKHDAMFCTNEISMRSTRNHILIPSCHVCEIFVKFFMRTKKRCQCKTWSLFQENWKEYYLNYVFWNPRFSSTAQNFPTNQKSQFFSFFCPWTFLPQILWICFILFPWLDSFWLLLFECLYFLSLFEFLIAYSHIYDTCTLFCVTLLTFFYTKGGGGGLAFL